MLIFGYPDIDSMYTNIGIDADINLVKRVSRFWQTK